MIIKFIKDIKIIALILFVTTLAYLPIFRNNFVIDDHVFIQPQFSKTGAGFIGKYHPSIAEAFRGAVPAGHEGVYRPLRGIIYTAYYHLFGTNPFFYHLHSLLVHLMATVLVFLITSVIARSPASSAGRRGNPTQSCEIASPSERTRNDNGQNGFAMTAGVAALLFGLHPVHTESITYIAASMEMTGVVFMLGAFWLYLKVKEKVKRKTEKGNEKHSFYLLPFTFYLSLALALLAFFTYEMTITLPILLVLYEFHPRGERSPHLGGVIRKTWLYWVGAGVYLFIRFVFLGIAGRSTYPGGSIWYALLTLPKVLIQYVWVTIWPVQLMNNHIISPGIEAFVYRGYRTSAIISQTILDPEILASITVIIVIIVITVISRKKHPFFSFGIGWFFLSLLPVMGFLPGGSMFNERMLYIPSVGWVMAVAFLFRLPKSPKLLRVLIGVILVLYGARTVVRNLDWHDDVTLWQKDVAAAPKENAYAYFALGNAYNDRKDYAKGLEAYLGSVTINPGFAVGYASLSRTYRDMGNTELSNVYYQKAQEAEPGFWSHP